MDETSLFKLSLICSLTGILILFIISESIEIKEYNISEINKELIDKQIKVKGKIINIIETPGIYIIDIQDSTGKITATLFKEGNLKPTLNKEIIVEAKVKEYKKSLELEISKVL